MKRTLAVVSVLTALLATAAAADDPAKQPRDLKQPVQVAPPAGQATVVAPPPTGYDVAIVGLSSTGPEGSPVNALKVTFENKGTKSLDHDLFLQVRANGQPTMLRSIRLSLAPGARTTWINDFTAEANLYPWGTEVWAKIDAQRSLREDDEQNNELTRTLKKYAISQPAALPRP